ncbi:MAG: hypothetical protein PUA52_08635, partial [Lachnospiraceae bacterium]|nr:hypothetical protein [Lachnospiraceae bacterium]
VSSFLNDHSSALLNYSLSGRAIQDKAGRLSTWLDIEAETLSPEEAAFEIREGYKNPKKMLDPDVTSWLMVILPRGNEATRYDDSP